MQDFTLIAIPFWGERTYVHSSQILDFLYSLANENAWNVTHLSLKILSPIKTQIKYKITKQIPEKAPNALCKLDFENNEFLYVSLYEEGTLINNSSYDDELELISNAQIDCKVGNARIFCPQGKRFFATLIALNKLLNIEKTQKKEKWLVAQVDMSAPFANINNDSEIYLIIQNCINNTMVRTQISINDEICGFTTFKRVSAI